MSAKAAPLTIGSAGRSDEDRVDFASGTRNFLNTCEFNGKAGLARGERAMHLSMGEAYLTAAVTGIVLLILIGARCR